MPNAHGRVGVNSFQEVLQKTGLKNIGISTRMKLMAAKIASLDTSVQIAGLS